MLNVKLCDKCLVSIYMKENTVQMVGRGILMPHSEIRTTSLDPQGYPRVPLALRTRGNLTSGLSRASFHRHLTGCGGHCIRVQGTALGDRTRLVMRCLGEKLKAEKRRGQGNLGRNRHHKIKVKGDKQGWLCVSSCQSVRLPRYALNLVSIVCLLIKLHF